MICFPDVGAIEKSMRVFDEMGERYVLTWTALIDGAWIECKGAKDAS